MAVDGQISEIVIERRERAGRVKGCRDRAKHGNTEWGAKKTREGGGII